MDAKECARDPVKTGLGYNSIYTIINVVSMCKMFKVVVTCFNPSLTCSVARIFLVVREGQEIELQLEDYTVVTIHWIMITMTAEMITI